MEDIRDAKDKLIKRISEKTGIKEINIKKTISRRSGNDGVPDSVALARYATEKGVPSLPFQKKLSMGERKSDF